MHTCGAAPRRNTPSVRRVRLTAAREIERREMEQERPEMMRAASADLTKLMAQLHQMLTNNLPRPCSDHVLQEAHTLSRTPKKNALHLNKFLPHQVGGWLLQRCSI